MLKGISKFLFLLALFLVILGTVLPIVTMVVVGISFSRVVDIILVMEALIMLVILLLLFLSLWLAKAEYNAEDDKEKIPRILKRYAFWNKEKAKQYAGCQSCGAGCSSCSG